MHAEDRPDAFVAFSAHVTAFTEFDLHGTGLAGTYLSTVVDVAGAGVVDDLLDAYAVLAGESGDDADADRLLRERVFSDDRLGPVARNVVKLWYTGTWYALGTHWHEQHGDTGRDRTFVVSPTAYTEGLVWSAIGANPSGAKGPGYGTWADPPRIPAG